MSTSQLTTHELWIEGRDTSISVKKTDPTSLLVSWTLPKSPAVFDGFIVVLSEKPLTGEEFPVDGSKYTASSNWALPADKIAESHVVIARYGFFNDDLTTLSVSVSNVDANKLYYASIHICSNILQYYTLGIQSYPLESSRFEKQSDTYAGSIPTLTNPPVNPTDGQIYYDRAANIILMWNDNVSAWIKASDKTVNTGPSFPIEKFKGFFNLIGAQLKIFNGTIWDVATPTNTRIKMGATWAPLNSTAVVASLPPSPVVGTVVLLQNTLPVAGMGSYTIQIFSIGGWFKFSPNLIQYLNGTIWENVIDNAEYGSVDPEIPSIGEFFYNTSTKDLFIWNSVEWVKSDTEAEGTPSTDKVGIGTDGSYDERLRLIKILKHQLGYPAACVELSEEQFNIAIDNSLDEFRRRADNAYSHRHIAITLKRGQSNYYLNDPRNKTDKIVSVIKVHRVSVLGMQTINNLYSQPFYNQLFSGQMMDLTSIFLFNQMSEQYNKMFAGDLVFTWDESSRNLMVLRSLNNPEEQVILEVALERTEQELLLDRWCKQWLQAWAESEALEMLGLIRSKYGNLPGPNGGVTMNGDQLLSLAAEKQTECLRQLSDFEVGNGTVQFGNPAFLIG